jgi:hypothetical protein
VPTDPGDDEREVRDRLRGAHSYHVGQSATCSKPHGGRAVLLGDAPAPFPAISQGFNAAVESAVVLDGFLAEPGVDPRDAAERYTRYGSRSPPPLPRSANGCCSIIHSTRCVRPSPWPLCVNVVWAL